MKHSLQELLFWVLLAIVMLVLLIWILPYVSTQVVSQVDLSNITTVIN